MHGERWHLDGAPVSPPAGGRIPLGASVGPEAGPTYLVVGDAIGAANPMSGAGIEYAVETGLLAAEVIDDALRTGTSASLQRYPQLLAERYAAYHKVGRLADRLLGQPPIMRRVAAHRVVARTAGELDRATLEQRVALALSGRHRVRLPARQRPPR